MSRPEDQPNMDHDLEQILESYYQEDPSLGDMVWLQNKFEDTTIRGEIVGMRRSQPQRALNPNGSFEIVLYPRLELMVGALDYWLDLEDWEITDTLTGVAYKKLPPGVVRERLEDEDEE
jgi:hypothetical protein